ncbi:MAG: tetratricopeptide repeat protein [Gemmatimonadetes bacterium]|nr:tetratricopeptide repeat protein [Gemmatimonadota bacterium]
MSGAPDGTTSHRRRATSLIALAVLVGFALRLAWPSSDPPARFSWSNGVYTDPAVMVHAARNAVLFDDWSLDYNRDLYVFPLMNGLTWIAYSIAGGPGRVATLVLAALAGAATVLAVAWGVRRVAGDRAGVTAAWLGAVAHFAVMFARVPIAENVAVMMLAWAAVAALATHPAALATSGALAVAATLFGKYHAVGWLPGLLAFVLLRHRDRRLFAFLGGGTVVFLAWLGFLFLPHRADILTHVAQQSVGNHGPIPLATSLLEGLGEFFNSVRRSWMFYRMPVIGTLGGLFVFWTVGNSSARTSRVRSGAAVWAFVFASQWLYYGVLSYKAPRYYVLLWPSLVAGTAFVIESLRTREPFRWRAPTRLDEHLPLAAWLFAFCFTSIDAIKHWASIALENLQRPPAKLSPATFDAVLDLFGHVDTFRQGLFWGGVFAILGYLLVLWHPEIVARVLKREEIPAPALRRFASGAFVLALAIGGVQWMFWAAHRTTYLEDVKSSLPAMIGPDAVVLGPLAPVLTQDTRLHCLPYYGPPGEKGLLEKYGVTHVTIGGKGDREVLESRYPGIVDSSTTVQVWPLKTLFANTLELKRLPGAWRGVPLHRYGETTFEHAADAAQTGQWEAALRLFDRFRSEGGADLPEVLSLEGVCWFKLEAYDEARKRLEEAIRRRPEDPLNYRNLAILELKLGDRAAALANLRTALRIDDSDESLVNMVRELSR